MFIAQLINSFIIKLSTRLSFVNRFTINKRRWHIFSPILIPSLCINICIIKLFVIKYHKGDFNVIQSLTDSIFGDDKFISSNAL